MDGKMFVVLVLAIGGIAGFWKVRRSLQVFLPNPAGTFRRWIPKKSLVSKLGQYDPDFDFALATSNKQVKIKVEAL